LFRSVVIGRFGDRERSGLERPAFLTYPPNGLFSEPEGRQKTPTAVVIHLADFDRDGLQDFLIFDPHNFDVPVRVGRNLGTLPGKPPTIRAR
jgi:hypothetical protein